MSAPVPTPGRIVRYKLSPQDVASILVNRESFPHVRRGNDVKAGDTFPMLITKTWGDTPESAVNGTVFLDGNDTFWATSASCGDGEHQYMWPT